MKPLAQSIASDLAQIRFNRPLVLNVTNLVAMDFTANLLLAVGASPIMAQAPQEMEELVGIAGALVINPGTLDEGWQKSAQAALRAATKVQRPVVFDPVGVGASRLRSENARTLLTEFPCAVIRGNASEILALGGNGGGTRGVDTTDGTFAAREPARRLATTFRSTVVVSGPEDLIVDTASLVRLQNGHRWMAAVTATGCGATSLIGAFLAVNPSPFRAALHAMAVMGISGEIAARSASGPGTFRAAFLDAVANLQPADLDLVRVLE